MAKQTHSADAANLALIPTAKEFTAAILSGNRQKSVTLPTLSAARIEAARMNATSNNGRRALVYAIPASGASILVPDDHQLPDAPASAANSPADAAKMASAICERITSEPSKKADAKKPDTPPAKRAAAKKPAFKADAKPKGDGTPRPGSKAEIAYKLLTSAKGTTRAKLVEACSGWNIDLKQFAARTRLKLKKDAEGIITARAKG